jgi:hypothetical protein
MGTQDIVLSCASVEQRDEPVLIGKPVMVGSPPKQRRGIVNRGLAFMFRPEFMWSREFSLLILWTRGSQTLTPFRMAHSLQTVPFLTTPSKKVCPQKPAEVAFGG